MIIDIGHKLFNSSLTVLIKSVAFIIPINNPPLFLCESIIVLFQKIESVNSEMRGCDRTDVYFIAEFDIY